MLRAAANTYFRSAEPSSSGGVPTAMNWIGAVRGRYCQFDVVVKCRPCSHIAFHHLQQAGFENRNAAFFENADLFLVQVQTQYIVTDFGHAGTGNKTYVASTNDSNFHVIPPAIVSIMHRDIIHDAGVLMIFMASGRILRFGAADRIPIHHRPGSASRTVVP